MAKPKHLGVKKYMIVYDVPPQNGKGRQQKREILRGVTKHEAESFLAKRIESVARGEYTADADMTMSDLFEKFMRHKAKRLEATTLDRYKGIIATYLRPTFGKMRLTALRKAHLIEAYEKWQAQKQTRRSGRTIRHVHDLLRATLNWAVSLDYLQTNVAGKITSDDLPKAFKPESTVLNENELRHLLAEAQSPTFLAKKRGTISSLPWFYPALVFAAYTGARRGEVLATRWPDLDLDGGTVTIRESLAQPRSGLAFKRPKNGAGPHGYDHFGARCRPALAQSEAGGRAGAPGRKVPPARPGLRDAQRHAGFPRGLRGGIQAARRAGKGRADSVTRPARHPRLALGKSWRADRGGQSAARSQLHRRHRRSLRDRLSGA